MTSWLAAPSDPISSPRSWPELPPRRNELILHQTRAAYANWCGVAAPAIDARATGWPLGWVTSYAVSRSREVVPLPSSYSTV
jgi:hypothetical protein